MTHDAHDPILTALTAGGGYAGTRPAGATRRPRFAQVIRSVTAPTLVLPQKRLGDPGSQVGARIAIVDLNGRPA